MMNSYPHPHALCIVDMQNYYIDPESDYCRYFKHLQPNCLDYLKDRCDNHVIPNIITLKKYFNSMKFPVIYLKLCGSKQDRNDLHNFFKEIYDHGVNLGFNNIYPLIDDSMADVIPQLKPDKSDIVIIKKTFSPFTDTNIFSILKEMDIKTLVMTGLATSQCVDTTARDASDRNISIIHLENSQANYEEHTHYASLHASQGVCGGNIITTESYLAKHRYQ